MTLDLNAIRGRWDRGFPGTLNLWAQWRSDLEGLLDEVDRLRAVTSTIRQCRVCERSVILPRANAFVEAE